MAEDGIVLEQDGGASDDYATLVTTDEVIAAKWDLIDLTDDEEEWDDQQDQRTDIRHRNE